MIKVSFYDDIDDKLLKYAVIISLYKGKYVFCKHRKRTSWEIPGGKREGKETILEAAERELKEETGAISFSLTPAFVYEVNNDGIKSYGKVYIGSIEKMAEELVCEIAEIKLASEMENNWTYPDIQPLLIEQAKKRNLI